MTKILNKLLLVCKYLLFMATFIIVLLILLTYYKTEELNINKDFINMIIPFILLIIVLVFNLSLKHKEVTDNIYYNLSSVLAFLAILFICYRTRYDTNMILYYKTDTGFNFDFFIDQEYQIKILLYLIFIGDIFLIISNYTKEKDKEEIINNEEEVVNNDVVYQTEIKEEKPISDTVLATEHIKYDLKDIPDYFEDDHLSYTQRYNKSMEESDLLTKKK